MVKPTTNTRWTPEEEEKLAACISVSPLRSSQRLLHPAARVADLMNARFPKRVPPFTKDSILGKFKRRPWDVSAPRREPDVPRAAAQAARASRLAASLMARRR